MQGVPIGDGFVWGDCDSLRDRKNYTVFLRFALPSLPSRGDRAELFRLLHFSDTRPEVGDGDPPLVSQDDLHGFDMRLAVEAEGTLTFGHCDSVETTRNNILDFRGITTGRLGGW